MLVTFKSAAAADVIMFGDAAKTLLRALGKPADEPTGIVTVEQLPAAIAALKSAIEEDKARHEGDDAEDNEDEDGDDRPQRGMAAPVSFYQRAWPLLTMLEYAQQEGKPVTWGV